MCTVTKIHYVMEGDGTVQVTSKVEKRKDPVRRCQICGVSDLGKGWYSDRQEICSQTCEDTGKKWRYREKSKEAEIRKDRWELWEVGKIFHVSQMMWPGTGGATAGHQR
jgi:hypothetical protein